MDECGSKWAVKHERPEKVPGCQDTSKLHKLEPGDARKQCFYYTCRTCSVLLALETSIRKYKTELEVIPRPSRISGPELFTEKTSPKYHGYHGEVVQFYANFLERVRNLTGVAINGWSNVAARKIFHLGSSEQQPKDFEIDWIIFNGSSITVVEVGEEGVQTGQKEEHPIVKKKLKQIEKDAVIVNNLINAFEIQEEVKINYLIVVPNLSLKQIQDELAKCNFFQRTDQQTRLVQATFSGTVFIYYWNNLNSAFIFLFQFDG